MSEVWQKGDLALCVKGGPILPGATANAADYPVLGRIYTVESCSLAKFSAGVHAALTLRDGPMNRKVSDGVMNEGSVWPALRFRKINPLTSQERESFMLELDQPVTALRSGRAPVTRG